MDEKTVTKQENFVCGQEPVRLLVWLIIVRANLSFGEITLFPPRTCLRVILFDVAQYSLKNGMTHSHHVFIFRRVFDRQFLHDVVEIAPFISSSDPLPCLSPPAFVFYSHDSKLRKLQKLLITSKLCCKHTREPLPFQNGALAFLRREKSWGLKLITRPLAKFC